MSQRDINDERSSDFVNDYGETLYALLDALLSHGPRPLDRVGEAIEEAGLSPEEACEALNELASLVDEDVLIEPDDLEALR